MSMDEKITTLYDELFSYLQYLVKNRTTPAEVESIPEVARVLIDLIILQSAK